MLGLGLSHYIPTILYAMAIAIALASIFYRVQIGLLFLVPLLPLQNVLDKIYKLPYGHNFVDILIISMLIGWLAQRGNKGERILDKTNLNWPIALYIIITGVGLLRGYFYMGTGFEISTEDVRLMDWKNLILSPILCLIAFNNVRDLKWIQILLIAMLVSLFLNDFFFFKQFRWVKTWHYQDDMRIAGVFTYLGPNELGAFFVQYLMIIVGLLLFATRRLVKVLLGILAAFTTYCLIYSFSRAGYLAFIVGILFILLLRSKKLLFVFVLFLFVSPLFLPVSVMERVQMTVLSEDEKIEMSTSAPPSTGNSSNNEQTFDQSAQGRFDIWKKAMDMFKSNPALGAGFRTFIFLHGIDTHNNFIKFLAELGIMGFSIYIYLYYLAFKSGWRLYKIANTGILKGLGLGFATCVIANMICNFTHDNWSYLNLMGFYWVFLALVARARIIVEDDAKK